MTSCGNLLALWHASAVVTDDTPICPYLEPQCGHISIDCGADKKEELKKRKEKKQIASKITNKTGLSVIFCVKVSQIQKRKLSNRVMVSLAHFNWQ